MSLAGIKCRERILMLQAFIAQAVNARMPALLTSCVKYGDRLAALFQLGSPT